MKKKVNKNNISTKAFTLIEMIIVLIIMWILLIFTVSLSGWQIQKIKDKSVKEAILAEMQSRYSRNLWSSSFAWKMYDHMEISFKKNANNVNFNYIAKDSETSYLVNSLVNNFTIRYLSYNGYWANPKSEEEVTLKYYPYKISCEIGNWNENLIIVTKVNNSKNYCFEINQKNCRLVEISETKCKTIRQLAWLQE